MPKRKPEGGEGEDEDPTLVIINSMRGSLVPESLTGRRYSFAERVPTGHLAIVTGLVEKGKPLCLCEEANLNRLFDILGVPFPHFGRLVQDALLGHKPDCFHVVDDEEGEISRLLYVSDPGDNALGFAMDATSWRAFGPIAWTQIPCIRHAASGSAKRIDSALRGMESAIYDAKEALTDKMYMDLQSASLELYTAVRGAADASRSASA